MNGGFVVKVRKKGSTLNVLETAKNFQYILILEGIITGLVAGLFAVLYRIMLENAENFVMFIAVFIKGNIIYIVLWFIFLLLLGLVVAQISKWEPLISGSGIPQVEGEIISFINQKWYRVLPAKTISGVLCALGGLSLGREGPSIQLGAMAGKGLASVFHRVKMEEQLLLTCGAAAGLSAAFNAPLAGVMFALEEVHKNFNTNVLISVMCASLTSCFISQNVFGLQPAFHFVVQETLPLHDYGLILLLGMITGILGVVYNKATIKIQEYFENNKFIKPAYGVLIPLLLAGVFTICLPQVLGGGYQMIAILHGHEQMMISTLLLLLVMKFIFSIMSFGSGAPGGIFFPLLVLGSFIGAIFGVVVIKYFHFPQMYLSNFIIMAMAGIFAAIVRAPITGIILIAEMCGTLTHLLPLAVVSLVAYLVASILRCEPIYESLLHKLLVKNGVNASDHEGEKHVIQIVVELGSLVCDACICEIKWPSHCLIISIQRNGNEIIPSGNTRICCGDTIIALLNGTDSAYVQHALEKYCCMRN